MLFCGSFKFRPEAVWAAESVQCSSLRLWEVTCLLGGACVGIITSTVLFHQSQELISVGNPQKSLENVCGWSYLQHREQSLAEQHDHTIYLTRQEFGPTGMQGNTPLPLILLEVLLPQCPCRCSVIQATEVWSRILQKPTTLITRCRINNGTRWQMTLDLWPCHVCLQVTLQLRAYASCIEAVFSSWRTDFLRPL